MSSSPSIDTAQLDRSLFKGIAWTGTFKWLSQVLTWASTLIVARILTPEDYGLVGMAIVYIGLVTIINEFGLAAAVIIKRELTDHQIAQLNTLAVLIGLVAFAVSCIAATPLADFFGAPRVRGVVVTMSLAFVISGFQTVPGALLQRDLEFKWLAIAEGGQALLVAISMVLLAILGLSYWTLVFGNLLGIAFITGAILVKRSCRFAWPKPRQLIAALSLSGHVLVGRLAWYLQSNTDFVVAGRVLGEAALGFYTIAWSIASVPLDKVSSLFAKVTPAYFSAVQKDSGALRRYLLTLTEVLSLITFPLAWGLALVADHAILVLLGEKWHPVAAPLQILACLAAFRSIVTLLPTILNVTGLSRFNMYLGMLGAVLFPVAFWIGSSWGTVGIAGAWVAVYPLYVLPMYYLVFRKIALPVTQYLRAMWPALSGAVVMTFVVVSLSRMLDQMQWVLPLRLVLEVLAGAIAYILVLLTFHRARLRAFTQFLRTLKSDASHHDVTTFNDVR